MISPRDVLGQPQEPCPIPRLTFHPHDRIGIAFDTPNGIYYRCIENMPNGYLLQRIDQPDLVETFTNQRMTEITASPGWRYRARYFDPGSARVRLATSVNAFHLVPRKELPGLLWATEWCRRFLVKEEQRKTSRSDTKMRAIIPVIAAEIENQRRDLAKRAGDEINLRKPPSEKTLRRWVKLFEEAGHDPLALRDNYRECGTSTTGLAVDVQQLIYKHSVRYADERRLTKKSLYEDLCAEIDQVNVSRGLSGETVLDKPSFNAFRKRVNELPAFDVYAGRHGVEAARKKFYMASTGLGVFRPGERVEIDEWRISLQTLLISANLWTKLSPKERRKVERQRYYLSAAIDVATRCFLGLRIALTASTDLAAATLKMAVTDKTRFQLAVGATTGWYMRCGIETIATDQGSAYINETFHYCALAIGAMLDHPPAGLPQMRAHVERSFGTIRTRLTSRFTGQTFANVADRGDYPAEKRASLTPDEIAWLLVRYVVDAYHNTPHEGLGGETPREAWDRLTKKYGVVPPPDSDTVRNAFGIHMPRRRLDQHGIRFLNLHYSSEALQAYRRKVGDCNLEIVIDPDDIGCISVIIPDSGWLTVPCLWDGLAKVPASDWLEKCADLKRRFAHNPERLITDQIVRDAFVEIAKLSELSIKRANIGSTTLSAQQLAHEEAAVAIPFPKSPGEQASDVNTDLLGALAVPNPAAQKSARNNATKLEPDPDDGDWIME